MADGELEPEAEVRPETEEAEEVDALAAHQADRGPTEEEEELADRSSEELEKSGNRQTVSEHHAEMHQRGVEQRGEGRIE